MKTKLTFFILILIFAFGNSYAQWVQTNGPVGGTVYSLSISGSNVFAGTAAGGVFHSTNNGQTWTQTFIK